MAHAIECALPCHLVDPDLFFPERGASTREAKAVCRGCEVRGECLEYALAHGEKFGIWGGLSERERRRVRRQRALERLSSGRATVLVATDVAARGIHIDDIALIIQADAPDEYKTYLHRSGRTGRAGKSGTVVTLVPRNRRRRNAYAHSDRG